MDHLADSIAKLSQGRKNWYIGREDIPVDDSPGEKCEPVVFECMYLSIDQRVNVSELSCLVVFRSLLLYTTGPFSDDATGRQIENPEPECFRRGKINGR